MSDGEDRPLSETRIAVSWADWRAILAAVSPGNRFVDAVLESSIDAVLESSGVTHFFIYDHDRAGHRVVFVREPAKR